MPKWLSAAIADHQSAPAGSEWLPPAFNDYLPRIDARKVILDPGPFFQTALFRKKNVGTQKKRNRM